MKDASPDCAEVGRTDAIRASSAAQEVVDVDNTVVACPHVATHVEQNQAPAEVVR